jgi:predicted metal-dependent RNase
MGNEHSSGKTIEHFLSEYDEVRTEYDNRMGEVKIYRKIKNPEIMVMSKERTFQDKTHFDNFMSKISRRQSLKSENISSLLLVIGKKFFGK